MLKNNCPNCAGDLKYSPKDRCVKCINCYTTISLEDDSTIVFHDLINDKTEENINWVENVKNVRCQDCGATLSLNQNSLINHCSYCGSANVIDIKNVAKVSPDAVVPFAFDETQAKTDYKSWIKNKHFLPNVLKKQTPKLKIDSTYFSSYVFNGVCNVQYNGVLEYTSRDSDGDTTTRRRSVKGEFMHKIVDSIIECSSNLTQNELAKISPYNLKDAKPYKGGYLFGYSAEFTDKTVKQAEQDFNAYLNRQLEKIILKKHGCDRVISMNLNISYNEKYYSYCLLPMYIINYEFKNKHYINLMNGQTGKLTGSVPRSGVQITIFVISLIILLVGIPLLIFLL